MLTPIDIQNHVLKSTMGGYNKKETDDFIESIQVSYEQLYKENSDLKKKITTLSEGIQYYKQMEGTLQKTLVLAEQTASETLETSKTAAAQVEKESRAKADVMLAEAKARADALVVEAKKKADALTEESETRAASLKRESEETAERLTRESQVTAERLSRESQEKAERLTRESQERADTLVAESQRKADSVVSEANTRADNIMRNANDRAERIMADTKAAASRIIDETKANVEKQLTESNTQLAEFAGTMKQLMSSYEAYKEQFRALLNKQLAQLEDDKYRVNVAGLEELMESQQLAVAEEQAATRQKLKDMTEHTSELDLPVEDTAPAGTKPEEDILAGGLAAETNYDIPAEEATSATVSSLNIDTPSSDEIASAQGIDVAEEEAVAYKPDIPEETSAEEAPEDGAGKLNDIDAIAAEALKEIHVASTDPFATANSMLGTSYDDFVPVKQNEEETGEHAEASPKETIFDDVTIPTSVVEAAEAVAKSVTASADSAEASLNTTAAEAAVAVEAVSDQTEASDEIPPTTTDELPTVQETYDAENYITSETYFGSADNMTYSIPDPKETSDKPAGIQAEEVSATKENAAGYGIPTPDFSKLDVVKTPEAEDTSSFQSNIPMPDFSKLDAQTSEETVPHEVPMPDFSSLAATAAEAVAALKQEQQEAKASTVQEEYDAETYVTQETYFGSADNIPYTGAATEVTDDFSGGISGVDPTADGMIPSAPSELFSAPSEFDSAPPADDEYAVTGAAPEAVKEPAKVTPFTFIDADN